MSTGDKNMIINSVLFNIPMTNNNIQKIDIICNFGAEKSGFIAINKNICGEPKNIYKNAR